MATKVQIANIALVSYLGMSRINSLDEPGTGAALISGIYEDARREILSEWGWSFANRRRKLVKLSTNSRSEWAHQYARPAHCVRINWVGTPEAIKASRDTGSIEDAQREIAEGSIFMDLDDAIIDYVHDIDETEVFPPKFVMAFAALLAARASIPGTETSAKAQASENAYFTLLDEAKAFDAQQSPPVRIIRGNDWQKAR